MSDRINPDYRYASDRSILTLPRHPPGSERRSTIPPVPPPKRHPYDQWSPDARALDLVGDKWTLLIVRDLAAGPRRFVELQRVLPGISTEQLRSRLNRMVADGLLTRQRYREVPPRVDYELTERSRELMPVLGALARWGYEWTWTGPRAGEDVNVGAIFRLAPGMLDAAARCRGQRRPRRQGRARRSACSGSIAAGGARRDHRAARGRRADAIVTGSDEPGSARSGPTARSASLADRGPPARSPRALLAGFTAAAAGARRRRARVARGVDHVEDVRAAVGRPQLALASCRASRARGARRCSPARPGRPRAARRAAPNACATSARPSSVA